MDFYAAPGRGCHHCETGIPIETVQSRYGKVSLCLECVLQWFHGKNVAWWEERHAPLADHLGDRLKVALQRQVMEAVHLTLTRPG